MPFIGKLLPFIEIYHPHSARRFGFSFQGVVDDPFGNENPPNNSPNRRFLSKPIVTGHPKKFLLKKKGDIMYIISHYPYMPTGIDS